MTTPPKISHCAIYTRKSTEHNLDVEFNSLDAQREACEAYVKSQAHEGWRLAPTNCPLGSSSLSLPCSRSFRMPAAVKLFECEATRNR